MTKINVIRKSAKQYCSKFWYDYIKPQYQEKANLCYMDTDSFIVSIKTEDVCKDIENDA